MRNRLSALLPVVLVAACMIRPDVDVDAVEIDVPADALESVQQACSEPLSGMRGTWNLVEPGMLGYLDAGADCIAAELDVTGKQGVTVRTIKLRLYCDLRVDWCLLGGDDAWSCWALRTGAAEAEER